MLPLHGVEPAAPSVPFSEALLTSWTHIEWVPLVGVLAMASWYLLAVRALHSRGDAWPVGRTIAYVGGGLGTLVLATQGPLAEYDTTLLSVHMVQHMLISMVAPIFLALGAPITLALRTFIPSLRKVLLAILHSTYARIISFPIVAGAIAIANPWSLYFTPLYELTLRNGLLHNLNHAHFLIVGCVWTFALIGIDPMPRVGYPLRMLAVFLTMPFHAFLGITIMGQQQLIAADWYLDLGRTWGASPAEDQALAGGILWAAGEFVALMIFVALFVQWSRASARESRRIDRALDRAEAQAAGE